MPSHQDSLPASKPQSAVQNFLSLVSKIQAGTTRRSENDLSTKLAAVLGELGLHPVLDTSVAATGGRKRPDILAYVSEEDADLVLAAEVVIEAKKPEDLLGFANVSDVLVSEHFWTDKTFPYLRDNLSRVQYFVLTTFEKFGVVSITPEIRRLLAEAVRSKDLQCRPLRSLVRENCTEFFLGDRRNNAQGLWVDWLNTHIRPEVLAPPPLSEVRNSIPVENQQGLELFAAQLAAFAAGVSDGHLRNAGLYHSISARMPRSLEALPPEVKRDLLIFLMAQHHGLSVAGAQTLAVERFDEALDEFIAASIHSLISRCFALKAIEDAFCIHEEEPLIQPEHWLFAPNAYEGLVASEIRAQAFARIRRLAQAENPVIARFAQFGFFFDWIETYIDPVIFRSLLEIFAVHDFTNVEGDVLGRFYELYAQEINRTRRKALGQYYTPLPVVQFIWWLVERVLLERNATDLATVLDPAMGSGTFLSHGARILASANVPDFWRKLTGFDISPQVMGIAHVNLYMAVLSQLTPGQANDVAGLQIYTTDALDHRNGKRLREILPLVMEPDQIAFIEQQIALSSEAKQGGTFYVVIGNPPYRNNSDLTLTQAAERFPRLLSLSATRARARERQIRDDYAWFFAAADHYIEDSGLICYIVSDSFATHISYRHFREAVLRYYRVRALVRLGGSVFPDVGYRMTFAIILLERRADPLEDLTTIETIPVTDLRHLIEDASQAILSTDADPRFQLMREIIAGREPFVITGQHVPDPGTNYAFYSHTGVTERVRKDGLVIHDRSPNRIFVHKWPGLITAFDSLFKSNTRREIESRISELFRICGDRSTSRDGLSTAVAEWGVANGFDAAEIDRLIGIALQIRQSNLRFDSRKVKRSFSGSMAVNAKWYPPKENTHYIYYEPALHIPRNVNAGKRVGWGTMEQWREPESHQISPKLIYSTASRIEHGYKGFVVRDEWYVKLHGGTRQQFHYTGLENPIESHRADRLPNNLTDVGLHLASQLTPDGTITDAILYYIAAVCNSSIASDLLVEIASAVPLHIRQPKQPTAIRHVQRVVELARSACLLGEIAFHLPAVDGVIPESMISNTITSEILSDLGITRTEIVKRGFRPEIILRPSDDSEGRLAAHLDRIEDEIDTLLIQVYS